MTKAEIDALIASWMKPVLVLNQSEVSSACLTDCINDGAMNTWGDDERSEYAFATKSGGADLDGEDVQKLNP